MVETRSGEGAFSPAKALAAARTISEAHEQKVVQIQVRSSPESGATDLP